MFLKSRGRPPIALSMGFDPTLREQERIAEALQRHAETLTAAERRAEAVVSGGFVVAALALLVLAPPAALAHPLAAAGCLVALVVALRAEFDTGSGFTVPSQLAFVPLLFAVPPSLVPVAVVLALVIAYLPDVLRGEMRAVRLLRLLGSAWFSVGPAVVLAVAAPDGRRRTRRRSCSSPRSPPSSPATSARPRSWSVLLHGAEPARAAGRGLGVRVDLALTPVGLIVAWHVTDEPWTALALVPLLLVLRSFGRERRRRVAGLVELNSAYRGTALVLGNVVEADDGYTGEHSRGVVELALDVGRQRLGLDEEQRRNLEFGALLHDVGKVAIPKEIINKPGKLDPHEWASSRPTPSRASACSTRSAAS